MSLKSLFGKDKKTLNVGSLISFERSLDDVESIGYIDQFIKDRRKFKTHTDFHTASNFCAYGSLEEYYRSGIDRIINTYPYDGSLRERLEWINDSSGFDLHLFENEYPRTNGYVQLGATWGAVSSTSGSYGNPASKEYILVKGGPNIGNVYNTSSHQTSNLEINGRSGNTVEFWLKKSSYETAKTNREVILDITTTGSSKLTSRYGRLTIELDNTDNTKSPFMLTYQSGSRGFEEQRVGSTHLYTSASDNSWHHYAFTFKNVADKVKVNTFVDGELNNTSLIGSSVGSLNTALIGAVGALVAGKDKQSSAGNNASESFIPGLGYGKLSGYLDEFRFWKKERSPKEVGRFWFTQVGAGSNKDVANSPLGFYFKFNEGETGKSTIDKNVLDYSGRVSNGLWVGYNGTGRFNNSAMVESSASISEFKDPIIYLDHPKVKSFRDESLEEGYAYDLENNSSLYYSFPNWIVDEDGQGTQDLKNISQIISSYFDTLHLQIKEIGTLRHLKYEDYKNKPYPFNNIKLESMGFMTPELFMDASMLNILANRDEDKEFEQSVADVKNFIYNNILNNLESIFKSKGTEKSFRNLFRCFGVDSELIKINLYSTDSTYPVESSYDSSTVKTKYANFANSINGKASIFQTKDGLANNYRLVDSRGFMKGTNGHLADLDAVANGLTVEAQLFFPKIYPINHPFHYSTPVSSSVYGCHNVADESDDTNLNWTAAGDDHSNFQLYVVKEAMHSKNAKFVLKSRNNVFDPMETNFIPDLYDSNRWNVAVRLSSTSPITGSAEDFVFDMYGATVVGDAVSDRFHISRNINSTKAKNFIKNSRRFYIGAERTNFTGDPHIYSDMKIANFRVWNTSLKNSEIDSHAIDPKSLGLERPSINTFPLAEFETQFSKINLLAINWNFSNLTGSNSNGEMWINDISSGSLEDDKTYGQISPIVRRLHPAKGIGFAPATTSSVDVEYDQSSRLQTFENVKGSNMVNVMSNDDITFTRETKPTDYYFSFEKSMYATITDEMLNFFAGIDEFSNLIGAPVERYRPEYKAMSKLRQIFFSRIQNTPDIERYVEYYKWLDSSLSVMIDQLVPASVAASADIRNVIESHALERSKYFNKFPTMDFKQSDPEGNIRGINELLYDWQHGHAPIGKGPNLNCLWSNERAQRRTDLHVTSSAGTAGDEETIEAVDRDRETIRRISNTSVSGSTYATRRLSRPYKLSVEDQRHLKGGDNSFGNKKKRLFTGISTAHTLSHIAITGSEVSSEPCKDPVHPSRKKKARAAADIAFTHKDRDVNDIAPFTLYSSSLEPISGYQHELHSNFKKGVDITNIHTDEYGDDREVALQSPFTERWVGGNQHRHQDLSGSLLGLTENKKDARSRLEAFRLLAQGGKLYILPPNSTRIDASNLPIIDPSIQGAQMLREELAKRPVNIKNIRSTTGSISLGNFNQPYDVVQYTSEDQRKDFLVDNDLPLTPIGSLAIPGIKEFTKHPRPARKHVFNARFSAPGGPETAGDSLGGQNLDIATNQYSVYNALNYRNLSVREPLNLLSSTPQTASAESNSLVTNHKVNANPKTRRTETGTDLNQDNVFVRHPIPQNDFQYSWITASLVTGREPAEIAGHLHSFTQASVGDLTGSLAYERTYEFLTASNRVGTMPIDFAGLNTNIRDEIDLITNTTTAAQFYNLTGTIHHRQGPYGWPSWKQIRGGSATVLGRNLSRSNIFHLPVIDQGNDNTLIQFSPLGNYSWPSNIEHTTATSGRSVGNQDFKFKEPVASSNTSAMVLRGFVFRRRRFSQAAAYLGVPYVTDIFSVPTVREPYKLSYTFGNNLARFANDKLSQVLGLFPTQLEQEVEFEKDELFQHDFTKPGATAEYTTRIFPKDENAFLSRTRFRKQYNAKNFWKLKRQERTQIDAPNSQGNIIPKLSVWPLDAHNNFKTVALRTTKERLGSDGAGELFANYSIFHNHLTHPSASALYSRPFPMQDTSSLPGIIVHDFRLFYDSNKKTMPSPGGKFTIIGTEDINKQDTGFQIIGATLEARSAGHYEPFKPMTNTRYNAPHNGGNPQPGNRCVPSFINNLGHTDTTNAGSTTSGPRFFNNGDSGATNHKRFFPMTLCGIPSTEAQLQVNTNISQPGGVGSRVPGGIKYNAASFLCLQYEGEVESFGEEAFLFEGFIRTGTQPNNPDSYGLAKHTAPLYLQLLRAPDVIENVGIAVGHVLATAEISGDLSKYSVDGQFHYFSTILTGSWQTQTDGDMLSFRFITPTTTNTPVWSISHVKAYIGQRKSYSVTADRRGRAVLPFMSGTVRSYRDSSRSSRGSGFFPNTAYNIGPAPSSQRNHSNVNFSLIDKYIDERSETEFRFRTEPLLVNGGGGALTNKGDTGYTSDIPVTEKENLNVADMKIVQYPPKKATVYASGEKKTHVLFGPQDFKSADLFGVGPFNFNNYAEFAEESRLIAKDYSVVPEFRISENMDYYINQVKGDDPFFTCNDAFLSITGSNSGQPGDSSVEDFYEVYSHSDFIKHFSVVDEKMDEIKAVKSTKLKLECKAYKKFLPYKGFYPADRMVELASEFSSSFSQHVTGGHWRNVLAPYYAPGIGFNSVKSGIAVDYPVFEPHEDRTYNQYGVIFQSASLAIDHGGSAVDNDTGKPWIAGEAGSSATARLSANRIEIGGGSEWARLVTGSLSEISQVKDQPSFTVSLWMYFPKAYSHGSMNELGMFSQRGSIISIGSGDISEEWAWKKGLHFGYHVSPQNNPRDGYDKDLQATHGGITIDPGNFGIDYEPDSSRHTGTPVPNSFPVSKRYSVNFVCFGGDGKEFFAINASSGENSPEQFASNTKPNTGVPGTGQGSLIDARSYNIASTVSPGWNHILLTYNAEGIKVGGIRPGQTGTEDDYLMGFRAFVNGKEWGHYSHLTSSFALTTSGQNFVKLEGHRNCSIGSHKGYVKRINGLGLSDIRPKSYQNTSPVRIWGPYSPGVGFGTYNNGEYKSFVGDPDISSNPNGIYEVGLINQLNNGALANGLYKNLNTPAEGNDSYEHIMLDFLKPSECMMSEIVILNDFNEYFPEALSGYPKGKSNTEFVGQKDNNTALLNSAGGAGKFVVQNETLHTYGAANPYTTLSSSHHNNIIGWYRPGNDSGYVDPGTINGMNVHNHAQNLYSGLIYNINSGSGFQAYDIYGESNHYNLLSGTMYGFSTWTGSVCNDLKFSDRHRNRWNGIVDITNPAQYTYIYSYPNRQPYNNNMTGPTYNQMSVNPSPKPPFKTWYANILSDAWFEPTDALTDKKLIDSNIHLSSAYAVATGSVKVPSFIQGTKHNFTSDSSIPRIGSASYGTRYNSNERVELGEEQLGSMGWRTDYQGNVGIRKCVRIPFEAVIDPSLHTPEMKDDDTESGVALFYEVEPHPNSSLLGAFNRQRKYVGQNDHAQQVFKWSSAINKQIPTDPEFITDENFDYGVAMNSSSVMAEFNVQESRNDKKLYTLAASNFYAETMNFFLNNKKGVTIRTSDIPNFEPIVGRTYKMSIELNRSSRGRDNPMYNNPAAFGMPFDTGILRVNRSLTVKGKQSQDRFGYGFSPFLPAHYDGAARAIYTFTPTEGPSYATISEILRDTTVEYARRVSSTGSNGSSGVVSTDPTLRNVRPSYNRRFAMQMSESFKGLSLNDEDCMVQSYDVDNKPIEGRMSLVIQSKFECPTFDFSKVSPSDVDLSRTSRFIQHLPVVKGLWHQTGSFASSRRPFVRVLGTPNRNRFGDLKELLGVKIENDEIVRDAFRVGEMPANRRVYEGVVAIPFKVVNGIKKYYNLPAEEVYQAVRNLGYSDYKLKTEEDRRNFREYANILDETEVGRAGGTIPQQDATRRVLNDPPTKIKVRGSIQSMVKSMMRYNIPPQFNFLKYNDVSNKFIKPFAMYIFDFSVVLEKEDIAKIWQNVTPSFGLDTFGSPNNSKSVISSQVVEHDLFNVNDILNPVAEITKIPGIGDPSYNIESWSGGIDEDTQWMVFKVKQKAESDYFRKRELDRLPEAHPERNISVENDIFRYGFNWPYDYFSLVELVNLKASVVYTNKSNVIDERTAKILRARRDNE